MALELVKSGVRSFKVMGNLVASVDVSGELFLQRVNEVREERIGQDVIDYQFASGALVFLTIDGSLQAHALSDTQDSTR